MHAQETASKLASLIRTKEDAEQVLEEALSLLKATGAYPELNREAVGYLHLEGYEHMEAEGQEQEQSDYGDEYDLIADLLPRGIREALEHWESDEAPPGAFDTYGDFFLKASDYAQALQQVAAPSWQAYTAALLFAALYEAWQRRQ